MSLIVSSVATPFQVTSHNIVIKLYRTLKNINFKIFLLFLKYKPKKLSGRYTRPLVTFGAPPVWVVIVEFRTVVPYAHM